MSVATRPRRRSRSRPPTISKSSPVPYYAQLADILRAAIADGRHAPGDALPSEADLGTTYGLSRTAVRQALDALAAEGLVRKEKGRGTFVTRPARSAFLVQELRGFTDELTEQGRSVDTEVLALERDVVPPQHAEDLQVPVGSEVVRLDRLRAADGEPLCLVRTLLPLPRFGALLDLDLDNRSLYAVLRQEHGVRPRGGSRWVEATTADRDTAALLDVEVGAPLLRLTSVGLDDDGTPFEVFEAAYRADRTRFSLEVSSR